MTFSDAIEDATPDAAKVVDPSEITPGEIAPDEATPDEATQAVATSDSRTQGEIAGTWREELIATAFTTAVIATFTGAEPTGTPWWDGFLAAALGVLVVVAGFRAHTYASVAAAALAAMFAGSLPWLVVALVATVLAIGAVARQRSAPILRAIAAGLTYLALLHLGEVGFFASSALIAAAALSILGGSGYWRATARARANVRRAAKVLLIALAAIVVISAYAAVTVRASATAGVRAAQNGLAAARSGNTQQLSVELERARSLLAAADEDIRSLWLKPLSLVPVGAQHLHSLSIATEQGLVVADDAVALSREANLDELQLRQGQFDLELLSQMEPRLTTASTNLAQAIESINTDRSSWLLPPVNDQIQGLIDEMETVLPETRLAAEAAAVMPQMLGGDDERRYLMLFGSPGESREFGGFIGGYALLSVIGGGFDLLAAGSINDLVAIANAADAQLDVTADYPPLFVQANPAVFPQNLTSSPNLSTIAQGVQDVFPVLEGRPIDGVIYADPFALAAMTEFTGPLTVAGVDAPLNQEGVVDFIFADQYRVFDSRDERFTAIGALAQATAANFQGADFPGPERLGEVLGPAARAGRLQVVTFDERENNFLASVRLQRDFLAPDDIDSFALIQANASESKLDLYLNRSVRYEVVEDDAGMLTATVDVTLESDIPADAPPLTLGETDGTNQVLLSLYSPHDLVEVLVNGASHQHVTYDEFGFQRHALFRIPIAPNESATVRFSLTGAAPEGEYRLGIWSQPLVNNDVVEVIYQPSSGPALRVEQELVENWLAEPEQRGVSSD